MHQYLDNWNFMTYGMSMTLQSGLRNHASDFLAIVSDLDNGTARPAQHWVQNLLYTVQLFSWPRTLSPVRRQRPLGHWMSLEKLSAQGHLHMRPLLFTLHDDWDQSVDFPVRSYRYHPKFTHLYGGGHRHNRLASLEKLMSWGQLMDMCSPVQVALHDTWDQSLYYPTHTCTDQFTIASTSGSTVVGFTIPSSARGSTPFLPSSAQLQLFTNAST